MGIPEKTLGNRYQGVKQAGIMAFLLLPGFLVSHSKADIYRFVTVDGIETFTDAPINKDARVIIKDRTSPVAKKSKKIRPEKLHEVSINEIAEKTVNVSLQPQNPLPDQFEPRLPPVGGIITSGTGMRIDPIDGKWRQHNGIDIALPEGTPVTPSAPGTVLYSGLRFAYGYTVIVEHGNGLITLYAHNSRLLVVNGQNVDAGTTIALSGNTGRSTGPHLHFEAWQSGVNVTEAFLPGSIQKRPDLRLAFVRTKHHFRKEILADGSLLFTNIPDSLP
jgi:murein DD-endopeptidase MepM/ murein hydrolase activator NlpD